MAMRLRDKGLYNQRGAAARRGNPQRHKPGYPTKPIHSDTGKITDTALPPIPIPGWVKITAGIVGLLFVIIVSSIVIYQLSPSSVRSFRQAFLDGLTETAFTITISTILFGILMLLARITGQRQGGGFLKKYADRKRRAGVAFFALFCVVSLAPFVISFVGGSPMTTVKWLIYLRDASVTVMTTAILWAIIRSFAQNTARKDEIHNPEEISPLVDVVSDQPASEVDNTVPTAEEPSTEPDSEWPAIPDATKPSDEANTANPPPRTRRRGIEEIEVGYVEEEALVDRVR